MSTCSVNGCTNNVRVKSKMLCSKHYDRWRKTGDPEGFLPARWDGYEKPICGVDDCTEKAWSLGYCRTHHMRFKKYGDPKAGVWHSRRQGEGKEWHEGPGGYVVRYDPQSPHNTSGRHVYQHRQVMGEILGRPLRPGENVHHKNGNRKDNRPENLELWTSGQPSGQRIQDVAQWAIEWLTSGNLETALALKPDLMYDLDRLKLHMKEQNNGCF